MVAQRLRAVLAGDHLGGDEPEAEAQRDRLEVRDRHLELLGGIVGRPADAKPERGDDHRPFLAVVSVKRGAAWSLPSIRPPGRALSEEGVHTFLAVIGEEVAGNRVSGDGVRLVQRQFELTVEDLFARRDRA